MIQKLKKVKKKKRKKYNFNSLEFRHLYNFSKEFFKDYSLIDTKKTPCVVEAVLLKVPFTVTETRSSFILNMLEERKRFCSLQILIEHAHRKVMQEGISSSYYDDFPHLEEAVPRNILNKEV